VDLYRAFFLRDRIGDAFEGTISGVMGFGFFVVIDEPFVEGLVRLEALSDDYYIFDETASRLVGRRSGRTFALGDTVKVEVQTVSVVRRKIDFALHEHRAHHGAHDGADGRGAKHGKRERRRGPDAVATERGARRGGDHHAGARGKRKDAREERRERDRARDVNKLKVSHAKARGKAKVKGKKPR
jgi:ribonuclease R